MQTIYKVVGSCELAEGTKQKDYWDKAEIMGKVVGSVLVPLVVALALFMWNSERTRQLTAASVTPLAISILTAAPSDEDTTALREWAVTVLNNPSDPPSLTDAAASSLPVFGLNIPVPPRIATQPCEAPIPIPLEVVTQGDLERLWLQDRVNLLNCAGRHEVLVAWSEGIANAFADTE
ncbi:hypothetical protein [Roseicyclus amphidinii]|uniref:hypothetical protein n=1 Tax=Roseicyclus amphidinii TaxID=3034232 RepID=UPI0024E15F8C|nr:hypothetical protein [Roseicyclus sp. Amp-Y-6]